MAAKIATEEQLKFLDFFRQERKLKDFFYLTGGTALSLFYFQHRLSEDLDFFAEKEFRLELVDSFAGKIAKVLKAKNKNYTKLFDRHIFTLGLPNQKIIKFEFAYFEHPRLKKAIKRDDLLVDDLWDMGANKLFCLFDRFEPKDYIDIFFLNQTGLKIKKLKKLVEKKFEFRIDPISMASVMKRGQNIIFPPKQLFKGNINEIKEFYYNETQKLKGEILL